MGKPSLVEPSASQTYTHGNQLPPSSDGASASREIFQGLFKDLGKQAMALESILRLVCGKVDKLEHWVTEMSFGMDELDLKLRNIAHNIDGTAANVDDVPPVSRWSVPQGDDVADAKVATVVKKVGVGLNKKKQMRMTGMVANILDQLTTVAETPTAAESESESHHDKKKTKSKAKKPKESVSAGVAAASTPRDSTKGKISHKKMAHRPADNDPSPDEELKAPEKAPEAGMAEEPASASAALEAAVGEQVVGAESEREELALPAAVVEVEEPQAMGIASMAGNPVATHEHQPQAEPACERIEVPDSVPYPADREAIASNARADVELLHGAADVPCREAAEPSNQEEVTVDVLSAPVDSDPLSGTQGDHEPESVATTPASVLVSEVREVVQIDLEPTSLQRSSPSETAETIHEPPQPPLPSLEEQQPHETRPPHPVEFEEPHDAIALNAGSIHDQGVSEVLAARTAREEAASRPGVAGSLAECIPAATAALPLESNARMIEDAHVEPPPAETALPQQHPLASVTRAPSKKQRKEAQPNAPGALALAKKGSRSASIRKSVAQRQPSLRKKHSQKHPQSLDESPAKDQSQPSALSAQPAPVEVVAPKVLSAAPVEPSLASASVSDVVAQHPLGVSDDESSANDSGVDGSSSELSSDSDESILDLDDRAAAACSTAFGESSAGDRKMTMKMTRTLTALNKLKKANVLTPEEIAELKQRANAKWFKLRDHIKEKNKKDVANILLKRKKNIFTVSNRIELLEEKSREVYAFIKQLNADLKGKVEASTFEGLRRHVHDLHISLQVLDEKTSKGNAPSMDHIKQLARDTEAMRAMFMDELERVRQHCEANHQETLTLFEDEWKRVAEIETSIQNKLALLVAEFDDKLHDLPDYTEALEGIRRAIRKKADLKLLRELEARLLGQDADSEDCLVRCLSCHKEVVNAVHDWHTADDTDAPAAGSPHFKRVNPGTSSVRVYRSNVPLNAHPVGISESLPETRLQPPTDEVVAAYSTTSKPKARAQSRRSNRAEEVKPSPLSFVYVTATRAAATEAGDGSRPISAPALAPKKKSQPRL